VLPDTVGVRIAVDSVERGALAVGNDSHPRDVEPFDRLEERAVVFFLKFFRDRRKDGVPGLGGRDRVGDPLGDDDGLALLEGVVSPYRFVERDAVVGVAEFRVFAREAVLGVAVVSDSAATFRAGTPRDRVHGAAVAVEIREYVAAFPKRREVVGKEAGPDNRLATVSLVH